MLAAVEKVNPDMPASVETGELKAMWQRGEIGNCIVEGPIAFDLAINHEAAEQKKYESPVAGEADLIIYPEINAGNIALKTITMTGHNKTGSVVLGLKCPVVMSSRGATVENKLRSLLLAAAMVSLLSVFNVAGCIAAGTLSDLIGRIETLTIMQAVSLVGIFCCRSLKHRGISRSVAVWLQ